jgi:transposase
MFGVLDMKKVKLVMDRGYYREKNLNALMRPHYTFIIGAKISLKFIQAQIAGGHADFDRREHSPPDTGLFIKTQAMTGADEEVKPRRGAAVSEKRRIYVPIYYNDPHATDDKIRFNKRLDALEDDIRKGSMKPEREKECRPYYDLKKTPVRGVTFTPKQEATDRAHKNFGFFALLSNSVEDPVDALRIYRFKDMIEKAFSDLKDRLNRRRTSVSSEENLEANSSSNSWH